MTEQKTSTHFGFQSVAWSEKELKVAEVFRSVAPHYDVMNDLMSFGVHRLWKRWTVALSQVRPSHMVLDLAAGSGDLTQLLLQRVTGSGRVVCSDINPAMLNIARDRFLDCGQLANLDFVQADASNLPFADNTFNCITMAFGLRNVTDQPAALKSIYRACQPGGKIMILEFSTPENPGLKMIYDAYSFKVLPAMGQIIAHDAASYRYLAESIRRHPAQDKLKSMIEQAGFMDCRYQNLTGGIVALHIAYKY
jgi:demethylmenaquinone methyltransferase/2-methoxy-6-polyprenyl-1,4-benzoquinol methylase